MQHDNRAWAKRLEKLFGGPLNKSGFTATPDFLEALKAVNSNTAVFPTQSFTANCFDAPEEPVDVAIGDFNNDGNPDVATAIYSSQAISVLLGDGSLDIAVTADSVNTVLVLLGNGTGTFTPFTSLTTDAAALGIGVGDFNNDGIPDIATANTNGTIASIFLGNGDGTFQAGISFPIGPFPFDLAVGDVNNDGIDDLVVSSVNDRLTVIFGTDEGPVPGPANVVGDSLGGIVLGDFNEDGFLDAVVAAPLGDVIGVFLGDGTGAFALEGTYATGDFPLYVTAGDYDCDGNLDLAVSNFYDTTGQHFARQRRWHLCPRNSGHRRRLPARYCHRRLQP